jgi:hypothetical protein
MSSEKVSKSDNSQKAKPKPTVLKVANVKAANIDVREADFKSDGKQNIAFVKYNHVVNGEVKKIEPLIQTNIFKITGHGIPDLHPDYYPDDTKRCFINIPDDRSQPALEELFKFLEDLDDHMVSDEVTTKIFGKKKAKYLYNRCIRGPKNKDNDNDNDEDGESKPKKAKETKPSKTPIYGHCKMHLLTNFETGDLNVLLFEKDKENDKIQPKTVTELCEYIRFRSEIRIAFQITRIWINKSPIVGTDKFLWGVGFKVLQILFTPLAKGFVRPTENVFLNDGEDEEPVSNVNVVTKKSQKDKPVPEVNDSDNDEDFDADISDEPVSKSTKRLDDSDDDDPKNKKNRKQDSDDENNDSDDEPEPVVKSNKKTTTKVVNDSDDEPEPVVKSNKNNKNVKAVNVNDSDSDEPVPIPPKSNKKTTTKVVSTNDSDDEPVPIPTKSNKKTTTKVVNTNDSDDEPVPVSSKSNKKATKVASANNSDEDLEEEEIKPLISKSKKTSNKNNKKATK